MAKPRIVAVKIKKTKKPKQLPKKPLIYMLTTGTPNQQGEPTGYPSEAKAKEVAADFFMGHEAWCKRHNNAGIEAISYAAGEVMALPVLVASHRTVECLLDEYTGLRLAVHLWKEREP